MLPEPSDLTRKVIRNIDAITQRVIPARAVAFDKHCSDDFLSEMRGSIKEVLAAVDDAGKNVTLPAELVACRSAGGVEAISLPIWLVRRIDRLCDAYDDWKREKPLKPETRSLIAGL